MQDFAELKARILALDEAVRPIAKRPFDLRDPNWKPRMGPRIPALDEAGIRPESDAFLDRVIDRYQTTDEAGREAIRALFDEFDSYSWASVLGVAPTTENGMLRQLLLFSIKDHGRDTRDAILALQYLCKQAKAGGVEVGPILRKVALLSSDVNKYGMGSTRHLLLKSA